MPAQRIDPRAWKATSDGDVAVRNGAATGEPSLGELFRSLSEDTAELVRQEMQLAKAELRETGGRVARDGARLGVAMTLANAGLLALTAFIILALGRLFGGAFWLSALILGVVWLGIGWWLGQSALSDLKQGGVAPTRTLETLREDAGWAKREAGVLKNELRS